MQIRVRLPLTIAVLIISLLGASFLGIYRLNQSLRVFDVQVAGAHQNERLVMGMLVNFKTQVQEWKNVLLRGGDPQLLERHWTSFEKTEQEVAATGALLTKALPTGEARRLVEQFLQEHSKMGEGYRRGLDAYKTAGFLASVGDKSVSGMDRAPARLLDEAAQQIAKDANVLGLAAHDQGRQAVMISLAMMLLVCLGSVVLSIWLTRSLIRPIREAVAHTEEIARGNLGGAIHATGHDELAHLLRSLNTMRVALIDVVKRVRHSSDSVSMASSEIAQGNQDLSARTERQASALQQTAASMEELSSTVRQNADNAQQANQLARDASSVAEQGGEAVGQVVHTMKGINNSSHQISEIIGVIDGIAFQTNILALNAAVEAARAGEQGRGFAVVAGEVRALAQRSADAAKQIKALIGESVQRVQQGSVQADQAGGTMGEVVSSIRRVTAIMGEISAASSEQSSGVSQIGDAVVQMDQATQQNAALVEQMAAAASSLKMQAQELVQAVAVFRLAGAVLPDRSRSLELIAT
ncbi:HAMP domain-containing protein [Hylemonella gracilis]|uniref:HAMP domain-containing protein n=1 Tax=Hylemonella gracilis TaxID=80880 RepID=A0A4P6UMU3_9BURK|nr:methyl-accepting chemotaxis protein [Hylemonella gracilis]QBK05397.1 HAMP domain-containing protein [Hylemonella gracilis]